MEIVSPGNKDQPESREAFVSKCHALLQQEVFVAIVDPVTERQMNHYAELAERMGAAPSALPRSPFMPCRAVALKLGPGGAWKRGNTNWPSVRRCRRCRCG